MDDHIGRRRAEARLTRKCAEQVEELLNVGGSDGIADAIAAASQLPQGGFELGQFLQWCIRGSARFEVLLQDFALPRHAALDR